MNRTSNSGRIFVKSNLSLDLIKGKIITVSVTEMPPFLFLKKDAAGNISAIDGYLADIWKILEKQLQFKTVLVEAGPNFLGNLINGTWNGMMGQLQSKKADVGLVNFGITEDRQASIDFSSSIDFDSSKFLMFSTGSAQMIDWKTFITTLSWEIWCCTFAVWIVTSIILCFATRSETQTSNFEYIFILFGAIASQGAEVSPQGLQGRVIFITYLFMCVILNTSFTALLTTNLTTASYRPMPTLEEALDRGFKISVIKGTQQHQAILESSSKTFQRIAEMFKSDPSLLINTDDEGIASTLDGKTLFLYDSTVLIYKTSKNCSFKIQQPSLYAGYLHLGYRKDLEYQDILDSRIIRLMSGGIMKKLAVKWLYARVQCDETREEVPSLGLSKTLFAFALISAGIGVSVGLLLLEKMVFKCKMKKKVHSHNPSFKKVALF